MNPADGSFLDPNGTMTVPAIGPLTSSEDLSKKIRKPYTITIFTESGFLNYRVGFEFK